MKNHPLCRSLLPRTALTTAAAVAGMLTGISAHADYNSTVLSDGPVAYYHLNETGVLPTVDQAANIGSLGAAGNGLYTGGAVHPVAGALAGETTTAARFPGANDRVAVPFDAATMGLSTFTIEAWVKPAVAPPPSGQSSLAAVLSCGKLSDPRTGWLIYQAAGGWNLRGYTGVGLGTSFDITGGPAPVVGTWYHIAATFDGSIARVYVNGVEAATSGTVTTFAGNTAGVLSIGTRSDVAFPYNGDVDEVAYYTTALNAATIATHYATGTNSAPATPYATVVGASSPAVYLRLNEPAFTLPVAVNSGTLGSALNGSYRYCSTTALDLDSPTYPGFAADNRVLQTSGTNGIVAIPPLNLNANNVTMECWIKRNGDQGSYNGVFFHRGGGGTATGIMFRDTSNELGYHWSDTQYNWASGLTPPDGAWTYVALAVQPDKAVLYMYDGTTWSSAENAVAHGVQAFAATTRIATDDGNGRFFNGLIDEAAIYNKTLTEGQLRTHALAGFGDATHSKPTLVTDPPVVAPAGTVYNTTPFSLTADAYGEPPLTFQWQLEGTNLPTGTQRIFARAAASASDAGNYAVVVGNNYGFVTSSVVNVTINPAVPPTITNPPLARLVYAGGIASFTVGADGTTPFTYQWRHAGTNLPNATNASLTVANCTAAEAGAYTVGVTNVAGGLLSASATLTLRTPAAGSYEALVVANGPLSYWRLNETSGTTAFDYMGGNDGAISGTVSPGATGLTSPAFPGMDAGNRGFNLDGSSGSVLIGNPASLNFAGPITMMAWVKPIATDGLRNIICHGYQTSPNNAEVGLRANGTVYTAWSWDGGVEASFTIPAEDIGNWVQVVGTHDGAAWHLYHNGVEVSSAASTVGSKIVSAIGWAIGARGTGTERFWNGDVDEVAIFNKALSTDTIAAMYATAAYGATTPPFVMSDPSGLIVAVGSTVSLSGGIAGSLPITYQWKRDGVDVAGGTSATLALPSAYFTDAGSYVLWATNGVGFTNTAAATLVVMPSPTFANLTNDLVLHLRFDGNYSDSSGHANDAFAPSGDPPFLAGKIGQGVHIATTPGVNYLVIPDNASELTFDETASFTLAFWLNYTGGFNDVPIIGNAVNSTWQLGWVFTDSATRGKLEWSLVSTANTGTYLRDPVPGCPTINDGTWHHVLAVVDRGSAMTLVYVDGVLAGGWSIKGLGSLSYGNLTTIGQDPNGSYGSATFDMDDVGIWRRALTAYEAASIYGAAQASGSSFDTVAPVKVYVNQVGGYVDVSWQAGTLLQSTTVNGTYTPVSGATAPFHRITPSASQMFFRVQQ